MAQDTFSQVWNRVLLYAPGTPVALAQAFVKNTYKRCLDLHYWSELYKDSEYTTIAQISTGTVAVTNGSATATLSTPLANATTYLGKQLRVGSYPPYYTITAIDGTFTILTLDIAYPGVTAATSTFVIADFLVEFPSDLAVLDDIRDANNNWRLRRPFHQPNYLDFIDPRRTNTGYPILYVPAKPRVSAGVAYPRYEFWPRIPASTHLIYRYVANAELTANADFPITLLKAETLVYGALSELCLWPGTPERQNMYFNMDLHQKYTTLFDNALQQSILSDLDRSQRMLTYDDASIGFPRDANFIQAHGLAPTT